MKSNLPYGLQWQGDRKRRQEKSSRHSPVDQAVPSIWEFTRKLNYISSTMKKRILVILSLTLWIFLNESKVLIAEEKLAGLNQTWLAHCKWWTAFWNRSWINVTTPEDKIRSTPELEAARRDDRDKHALMGSMNWNNRRDRDLAISGDPIGKVLNSGYALQRFIMAASGRGAYPIKFNGSIFTVNTRDPNKLSEADYRSHGPNYWWQNTRLAYWPMLRSGDYDMMLPLFSMYRAMVPMAIERTKLYYGHEGIFFPETLYPWGTYSNDNYSHHLL